jgi:hypothetical protein
MLTNRWMRCRTGELDGGRLLLLREVLEVFLVLRRQLIVHGIAFFLTWTYKPGLLEQPNECPDSAVGACVKHSCDA